MICYVPFWTKFRGNVESGESYTEINQNKLHREARKGRAAARKKQKKEKRFMTDPLLIL